MIKGKKKESVRGVYVKAKGGFIPFAKMDDKKLAFWLVFNVIKPLRTTAEEWKDALHFCKVLANTFKELPPA